MIYDYHHFLNKFGDDLSYEELDWISKNGYINQPVRYGRLIELANEFDINKQTSENIHRAHEYYLKLVQSPKIEDLEKFIHNIILWIRETSYSFIKNKEDINYIKNIVDVHNIVIRSLRQSVHFFPEETNDFVKNSAWRYFRRPVVTQPSLNKLENQHLPFEKKIEMIEEIIQRDKIKQKSKHPFKLKVANAMRYAEVGLYEDALKIIEQEESIGHSVLNYSAHLKFKLERDDIYKDIPLVRETTAFKAGDFISNNYIANMYFHYYIFTGKKDSSLIDEGLRLYQKSLEFYRDDYILRNKKIHFDKQGCRFMEPFYCLSLAIYPYFKYILLNEEFSD